jgi:two-component system OmpR family sensor kinase
LPDHLSLRARLLLGVVVLAGVGLVAADVATYTSLRSFLLDRVDKTLEAGHVQVERIAFNEDSGPGQEPDAGPADRGRGGSGGGSGPPAQGVDWYQVRTPSGHVVESGFLVGGGSPPKFVAQIPIPATATSGPNPERVSYLTVSSQNGSTSYRVRASIEPQRPNRIFLIATSLHDVNGTLHRLLMIELLVTLAALGAIAGLGLWVIRLGLRPLREIEGTAATIAAGDLSQRVERPRPQRSRGGPGVRALLPGRQLPRSGQRRRRAGVVDRGSRRACARRDCRGATDAGWRGDVRRHDSAGGDRHAGGVEWRWARDPDVAPRRPKSSTRELGT